MKSKKLQGMAFVALCLLAVAAFGSRCKKTIVVVVDQPGFVEANTPGAVGAPAASAKVQQLLGTTPDLNRIQYIRTSRNPGSAPQAILILIPGFLGGAATFQPMAERLVFQSGGTIEVWTVDRRPNQLEDRRGSLYAQAGGDAELVEAAQLYFPDLDLPPISAPAAGAEDFDVNGNGLIDPPFELPDAIGGTAPFIRMEQDDVRFMAHWGVDTYARDWKLLVEQARSEVGPNGLVIIGGHSQGTSWSGIWAAYDFDPGPGVDAAHELIDGLLLLEGGGPGAPSGSAPNLASYQTTITNLENAGGPDVYLASLFGLVTIPELGAGAELTGIAGVRDPDGASLLQRTSFGGLTIGLLIPSPASNEALVGLFLDDEFSAQAAFRASLGFSDNGTNFFNAALGTYIPVNDGTLRTWKNSGDPTIPSCPPAVQATSPGCALIDNGPEPAPTDPPAAWGQEVEVTDIQDLLRLNFTNGNFAEWYFMSGRLNLDFSFGRDSSGLGDESLLAVTQNANMDAPVLCIGGSNGLTPTAASFANYLGSIATPVAEQRVEILEGYAHLDPLTARKGNAAVPIILDWVNGLLAP